MQVTAEKKHAQAVLETAKQLFGFAPNLIHEMVEYSPTIGEVYLEANKAIATGRLTEQEQQAVILTISTFNNCHYCRAAHTAAGSMAGLSEDAIEAIKATGLPQDERLRTLVQATRRTLTKHGWLTADDLAAFEDQGVDRAALYEIVALIGIKTISNYVNHIAGTEIDPQFK